MNYKLELARFRSYLHDRVQPGTRDLYIYALDKWFKQLAEEPTKELAQSYVDSLAHAGKSPSTVSTRAHAIMRWFRWKGDPMRLDCPTIRVGEPKYLTMDKIEKVIGLCVTVLEKVLVVVLFDTAIRISELLNLELDDIDRERGLISVIRKGGTREEVNISERALEVLDEWISVRRSKSKNVFMGISYWNAWDIIKALGKRVKVPLHPHIFRHSRAVQMLLNGATLHDVQLHLGHRSITTTANIYGRFRAMELKGRVPKW